MVGECLVLLFTMTSCGSCSTAKHYLDQKRIPHQVVNVLQEKEKARVYGVWGTPTLILTKKGAPVVKLQGFDKENFEKWYTYYCS